MTADELRTLKAVALYMLVFLAAFAAVHLLGDVSLEVTLGLAAGAVAVVAIVDASRQTNRSIETEDEDFQRAVRDLDDSLSDRGKL